MHGAVWPNNAERRHGGVFVIVLILALSGSTRVLSHSVGTVLGLADWRRPAYREIAVLVGETAGKRPPNERGGVERVP